MDRENILERVLNNDSKNILLELPTGYGKTRYAIEKIKQLNPKNILIVIPRNVLKENWSKELEKWGGLNCEITYSTYVSIPKNIGSYDIIVFDECFKGDTEILTDEGYKRFDSLRGNEKVAQFTDDGIIEFVQPIRHIKKYYKGDLCKLTLRYGRHCYMTPNHNQVYCTSTDKNFKISPVKDLNFNHYKYIPVSGRGSGNNDLLSPLEQLFIAIQADGTLQRHQKKESVYSIQVTKSRKKERLLSILSKTNNYTKIKGRAEVDRYMVKLPKGNAKLLSTHFDINMGYDRANSFIDEIIKWDGSESMNNTLYYSSKIKENVDFVSAVAVQAGYTVLQSVESDNRKETFSDIHRLYIRKKDLQNTQQFKKEYEEFEGFVYCVEVPSHKIVVRSEGYTFISGNCHHLSERCRESIQHYDYKNAILLSATVKHNLKQELYRIFKFETIKVSTREAIENEVLPEPIVYLIPMELENTKSSEILVKNPKGKTTVRIPYANRWNYLRNKEYRVELKCTQQQYIQDLNEQIEWYKKKALSTNNILFKNKWLYLCSERLKYLATIKNSFIKDLLLHLKNYRTLTFCTDIKQTEELGKYCINSKNKSSEEYLNMFNNNKIKHITACNSLNEGVNLNNCRIGIFANVNASEIMTIQKVGRILRHKQPIVIIPYYKNTREQELVINMLENFNKDNIKLLTDLKDLKL